MLRNLLRNSIDILNHGKDIGTPLRPQRAHRGRVDERLRKAVEVQMLDEMDQDDAGDGYASEDVCAIDSCIRFI